VRTPISYAHTCHRPIRIVHQAASPDGANLSNPGPGLPQQDPAVERPRRLPSSNSGPRRAEGAKLAVFRFVEIVALRHTRVPSHADVSRLGRILARGRKGVFKQVALRRSQ
jgi:hypothetical protein